MTPNERQLDYPALSFYREIGITGRCGLCSPNAISHACRRSSKHRRPGNCGLGFYNCPTMMIAMNSCMLRAVIIALACVLCGALTSHNVAAAESSLLEGKGVADAVAHLTEKMKAPVHVLSIEIKPATVTLQVQDPAAPAHIDEYSYVRLPGALALLGAEVSGPKPVRLSLINPRLEENLFNLAEVNLAAAPETIREALQRVKIEGGAVEGITIRRQLLLNQSGPVEWSIYVRSPRESATAYADAAGKIRRVDLSGTTRAETLDLTQGGAMLTEALALVRERFGVDRIYKNVGIASRTVSFKIRDPKNPADSVGYYWDINGIQKSTDIMPASVRQKMGEGVRDEMLFSIDDVDWSRLPELRKAALEKAAVSGGHISSIDVDRPSTQGDAKPVRWKFDIRAGLLGESSSVEFDAKSGALTRLNSPKSRQEVVNYLEPDNARRAIAAIGRELNRAVGFVEIMLSREKTSATAPMKEKPDLIRQFFYTEKEGVSPFGDGIPGNPFHPGFNKTWLFTVDEIDPVLPILADLEKKTLERLRVSEGKVERVTFFRHSEFYPDNRKMLAEIRVENAQRESGRVVYDLAGAVIDVVGGAPEKGPSANTEAESPANLRTLGMTDATPKRVAKFESFFATFLKLNQKFGDNPWYKLRESAPDKLFTWPREEFRKFGKVQCDMLEAIDGMLKVFAERTPPSDAIASSKVKPHVRTREFWEAYRKVWDACCQQYKVLDKNWADWKVIGNPSDVPDKKPWQQEVDRFQSEIEAAQKRVDELSPQKK